MHRFCPAKHFVRAALILAWLCAGLGVARAAAPNVLLIISDDHGWRDYSFTGHPRVRTPHIDALARESLTFRRGYVPSSLCCPSLASIITGLYPHQHKVTSNDPPLPAGMSQRDFFASQPFRDGREIMARHLEAVPTLPRLLAQSGYRSLQTGKWWQGDYRRGGFTHGMTKGERHGDEGLEIGRKTMQPIYDFIAQAQADQKPFFAWYAPMMPHEPHTPPQRLLERYRDAPSPSIARYWAMIEWFDETVGALLNKLDDAGLGDDTLVVYLADNGWIQNPDGPRFAPKSKQSPYDGGLRTPILVRWRKHLAPRESNQLAISIDIAPTLLAAIGREPTRDMQGVNLLDEQAVAGRRTIFGECFTHSAVDLERPSANLRWRWAIDGQWKLLVPHPANEPDAKPELYDLGHDPDETNSVVSDNAEVAAQLRAKLDSWWKPQ
ncbi:MAG TPA: sulfatase [Pirellulales bacterium]|jgi:arylsulfatase A-like enzyme|nr:sulfatase [Pirellulales bacterium]